MAKSELCLNGFLEKFDRSSGINDRGSRIGIEDQESIASKKANLFLEREFYLELTTFFSVNLT